MMMTAPLGREEKATSLQRPVYRTKTLLSIYFSGERFWERLATRLEECP